MSILGHLTAVTIGAVLWKVGVFLTVYIFTAMEGIGILTASKETASYEVAFFIRTVLICLGIGYLVLLTVLSTISWFGKNT